MDDEEITGKSSTRGRRFLFHSTYWLGLLLFLLALGETAVRLAGYSPWEKPAFTPLEQRQVRVRPNPDLGYELLPGKFTVRYSDEFSYQTTHTAAGLRSAGTDENDAADKPGIWIFGCSFTYGESLNDEETYPWLLQARLPEYKVSNFGVVGYGTLQSLIQFQRALAAGTKPAAVIVSYASFHDERNAALRSWRKWNQVGSMPYARLGWDGTLAFSNAPLGYTGFPLMQSSALMHFLEKAYNRQEGVVRQSHAVSEAVLLRFAEICRDNGIKFIVAGITSDKLTGEMLTFLNQKGIMTTDISVDLNIPGNRNLPYDQHPSARANAAYAERLTGFLERSGLTPDAQTIKTAAQGP